MGLQIPSGMDYEVSVRGAGRGCRAAGEGALTRDRAESGDDDLRRGDQSGSGAFADLDTAECVGVAAVQFLKGKSSHRLLSEYAVLRKRYWGQHLWARGYW